MTTTCDVCDGTGFDPPESDEPCSWCDGTGEVEA